MTRSADIAVTAEPVVPAGVLDDGEIVILATKPSGWFVLLVSWPVLLLAVLGAAALWALDAFGLTFSHDWTLIVCTTLAAVRLLAAGLQWLGRLYVLTNHRILRVRSLGRMDVASWPLRDLRQVQLLAGPTEQRLGTASLAVTATDRPPEIAWLYISRPLEIHRIVTEALHQSRR